MINSIKKQLSIEFKLLLRQPLYLVFSIIMPAISLLMFGSMNQNVNYDGIDFFSMYIPSFAMIIMFAGGVYNTGNQIVADKEQKIYKRIMVTPIKLSRFIGVILFKNFVVSVIGFIIILIISNIYFHVPIGFDKIPFIIIYLLFILFALSIGIGLAILSNRINVYSTVMMILFMPMFILSDATIPLAVFPDFIQKLAFLNPLYHCNIVLRYFWSAEMRNYYNTQLFPSLLFLIGVLIIIYIIVFLNRKKLYED